MPPFCTQPARHEHVETAWLLSERDEALAAGLSERAFCAGCEVPRATLRAHVAWWKRREGSAAEVAFFASPEGQAFLARLVLAAHFIIAIVGPGGIPLVCTFLELAGLSTYVATSYHAQRSLHLLLLDKIAAFGREERERLGKTMPSKSLWLCEDETFFPEMVLVAIEACSGFILVESLAQRRDASAWHDALLPQLQGLPVRVQGVTADQAKGIVSHVRQAFGLCATPDLFHVQHDLCSVTLAPLRRRVASLKEQELQAIEKNAAQALPSLREQLQEADDAQQRVAAAIEMLAEACHPYNERTGEVQWREDVEDQMFEALDIVQQAADEMAMSDSATQAVIKAVRAVPAMGEAVQRYHEHIALCLKSLNMPQALTDAMRTRVLPAFYLEKAAAQSSETERRERLLDRARELVRPLQEADESPLLMLSEATVTHLFTLGRSWVRMYERTSSCVEGRNGQLSRYQHGHRRLSARKLAALTVLHNFWTTRDDDTTPAQRLFQQPTADLFDYLLDVMPNLPRPAQKRPHVSPSPLLN